MVKGVRLKDVAIDGKIYRVIVEPANLAHPESPQMAVFVKDGDNFNTIRDPKIELPSEDEESLLQEGLKIAEDHAKSSASLKRDP